MRTQIHGAVPGELCQIDFEVKDVDVAASGYSYVLLSVNPTETSEKSTNRLETKWRLSLSLSEAVALARKIISEAKVRMPLDMLDGEAGD